MARRSLTEREVNQLKQEGRHSIGGNLMLQISGSGGRSWLARITDHRGRRRDIGLGSTRDVTLARARENIRIAREAVAAGRDPIDALNPSPMPTFEQLARRLHADRCPTYRNAKHRMQWINSLEKYVFPRIGDLPIDKVESSHLLEALSPIWLAKEETARRVLQRVAAVVAFAVPLGHRAHELPLAGIRQALPRQRHTVKHHAACSVGDAPSVYQKVRDQAGGTAGCALQLILLTAVRSGEARGARWCEFDLQDRTWIIPGERMKTGREHRVALSDEAVRLLQTVPRIENKAGLVFPNSVGKPLSDTAVSKVFKRFAPGFTVHGWRSTFKDWSTTATEHPDDVSEAALAHVDTNKVRAAYKRTDLLDKRRALMADWNHFLLN
ncbi:tyrosine-type recombinase/integrase [Erythrobacter gaetbuli]|uniref:Tyrosine-type recombinase/integrase n=1 Tax=Qipengyuania gaetbuli TaxID=266952 RepID=A0A844XWV2_9SPHN|nr:tyrosine-type recombinase/integrase [Qipengyuania gaetbuli]